MDLPNHIRMMTVRHVSDKWEIIWLQYDVFYNHLNLYEALRSKNVSEWEVAI